MDGGRSTAMRPRRAERGASLVEFALLLPVLVLILLGTITGGLTLSRHNSVKNAVREASRFGAVLPDLPSNRAASLSKLYQEVKAAASGDLDPGVDGRVICVAIIDAQDKWSYATYTNNDSGSVDTTGTLASALPPEVKDKCESSAVGTTGQGTTRVWVRAARTSEVEALLYSEDWELDARAFSRYER